MFNLHLANNLLKKRCEDNLLSREFKKTDNICVIPPKKGCKRFFDIDTNVIAANDSQTDIWQSIKDCTHIFCYDFDNFPIDTQKLIYHINDKEVNVWAKPSYVRDQFNFADCDYLYQIYISQSTMVHIVGDIKFQLKLKP